MIVILIPSAFAGRDPDEQMQVWAPVVFNGKIHKRVLGGLELQPRVILSGTDERSPNALNIFLIRSTVGVKLSESVSVWQGYLWAPAFNPEFRNENRLFQQLLVENKFKHFTLSNRTRFEQRFIENVGGTSLRGRHRLLIKIPLSFRNHKENPSGKNNETSKWSLVMHDEFFVNFNDTTGGQQAGFDQNRVFIGLDHKLNKHLTVEAGYLNNFVNSPGDARNRMNHVLLVGINVNVR